MASLRSTDRSAHHGIASAGHPPLDEPEPPALLGLGLQVSRERHEGHLPHADPLQEVATGRASSPRVPLAVGASLQAPQRHRHDQHPARQVPGHCCPARPTDDATARHELHRRSDRKARTDASVQGQRARDLPWSFSQCPGGARGRWSAGAEPLPTDPVTDRDARIASVKPCGSPRTLSALGHSISWKYCYTPGVTLKPWQSTIVGIYPPNPPCPSGWPTPGQISPRALGQILNFLYPPAIYVEPTDSWWWSDVFGVVTNWEFTHSITVMWQ